jgi:outer membrane receptor protein involved in Fe transport
MTKQSLASFALALALTVPAYAQSPTAAAASPAPAVPAASTPGSDELIELSPFDVAAQQIHGYTSSESETGTRIASQIIDVPFSVSVVTNQFMNDFAAYNLNQQLGFVAGYSPSEVFGQGQLRGFPITSVFIDGFRRIGLIDTVDIDRVEVIKGSDASIYGAIQPGGAINYVTKQPTSTPQQSLSFAGGSDNYYRATASSSGPMGDSKSFFYRVDLSDQFNNYQQEFASDHRSSVTVKLQYKPDNDTSVTLALEHDELYEHPYEQALTVTEKQPMAWAGNAITESQYFGMALAPQGLLDYNFAGPQSYNHNRDSSITLTAEHKVSQIWSIRFAANAYTNPYNDQLVGSGAYYPYGTGNIYVQSGGLLTTTATGTTSVPNTPEVKDQPQVDWKPQKGGGYQLDNLLNFDTGPVSNKLLFTTDFTGLNNRTLTLIPLVTTSGGTSQATDYYALYSPYSASGSSYYVPGTSWNPATLGYGWNTTLYGDNPSLYNGVSTDQDILSGDYGFFLSEHASAFNDRLNLIVGGRFDWVRSYVDNYNLPANAASSANLAVEPASLGQPAQAFAYNTQAWTYQMGLSYKVLPDVAAFVNRSTAFNPQPQINSLTGLAVPNNKSYGYDWGFKTDLWGDKLALTVDRFAIYEYNILVNETDPVSGEKDSDLIGQQLSKGEELQLNYQPTNNLLIQGDWGYTQSQTEDSYQLPFYNGLAVRRVPRDNVGLLAKYTFGTGPLKGLYILGGGQYYSKSLVNLGSGKALDPGPAASTANSTLSMYYVPSTNLTYIGSDPKIAGEVKSSNGATPFYNVPFPGSGDLPYPNVPAGTLINYPVNLNGTSLPVATGVTIPSGDTVWVGQPTGVFVDDGRENNFNAPYFVLQIGAGYTWRWGPVTNNVQVNVQNLLNRQYTYGSGTPGAPFGVLATYTMSF